MRSVRSLLVMQAAHLGSLNALEQARAGGPHRGWVGPLPSADALGDAADALSLDDLREELFRQYTILKRNKVIRPLPYGFLVLVLDGHECGASYLRKAEGALVRRVQTTEGDVEQFYYRHVAAMLLHAGGEVLLDIEPLLPGEGEITAALRLFERVAARYPRAFDTVAGDALYLNPDLCRLAARHDKYFIAVLKNEQRDLVVDVRGLLPLAEPHPWTRDHTAIEAWDLTGLKTWPQYEEPVRVVRTIETTQVRRQRTKKPVTQQVEWMWATNIPAWKAPCQAIVPLGHGRWSIENQGFNEIVNAWHGDHIYRNTAHAVTALFLLLFFAYNLFHAFFTRNIQLELRAVHTMAFFVEQIRGAFYVGIPLRARPRPP